MEFVNLKFADEKMIKMQTLLPALRWSRANVSLNGPTGTGKSTLAKYIVSGGRFEELDIKDIGEAFVFADFFNQTSAQTFLIENVEFLSAAQQKALYDVLESQDRTSSEGRRLVSTSRVALKNLVQKNLFREDLYYRLTVLTLEMPALEARLCDLKTLADHLMNVFGIIHKKSDLVLTSAALEKMMGWRWPGNIRELENVLERAVILSKNGVIDASEISLEIATAEQEAATTLAGLTLSEVEQKLILQTLKLTEQNRTRAAEILGISIRTLRNKINEYKQAGVV